MISNGLPSGLIWDGEEMLAIEALSAERGGPASASIYRLKDTYVEPGSMSCGAAAMKTSLATALATVTGELDAVMAQAVGAIDELKIGIVSDFEFTRLHGDNVDSEIVARMNNVDGIFSEQLGVQITVDFVEVFTEADDPFTSSVPEDLLVELSAYRFASQDQRSRGLTFLFTGRDLEGRITGIAYQDVLCETRYGAGLARQPGIVGQALAWLQMLFQPGRQGLLGDVARRKQIGVHLLAHLQGITAVDEDRRLVGHHAGHAGGAVETGQPGQALGRRRHILALVFVAARHQEAVDLAPRQFLAQSGQTGGMVGARLRSATHRRLRIAQSLGVRHGPMAPLALSVTRMRALQCCGAKNPLLRHCPAPHLSLRKSSHRGRLARA